MIDMGNRVLLTGIIMVSLISSGCMNGGGGGGPKIGPGGKTITVTDFGIQPKEIRSGYDTQIQLGLINTGVMDADVTVGDKGKKILRNYCPDIFTISDWNSYSSRSASVQDSYTLKPGEELQMSWTLKNSNTGSVPVYGYKCSISMQIPFDYSVSAYQQLQVKRNSEIQGTTTLESRTSRGPLNLNVEMIGSSSDKGNPTFIQGDTMEVLIQMENTAPDESSYQGLVNLTDPTIETSENFRINKSSCNVDLKESKTGMADSVTVDENLRLYQGDSRIVRCEIAMDGEMTAPSIRGQIESKVNYTYIKDLGESKIEVKYGGN